MRRFWPRSARSRKTRRAGRTTRSRNSTTDRGADVMTAENAAQSAGPDVALEAIRLTLDYPTDNGFVRAVENIDIRIHRGERLVLLGPSGCGKSSILKAVAGFIAPSAGRILVNGSVITGPGPDRIVVFQEFDQ